MHRKLILLSLFVCLMSSGLVYGQHAIEMRKQYGSEHADVQRLLNFEDIYFEQLRFKGESLKGKSYQIFLREFKNGAFARDTTLFDGGESEFFTIKSDSLTVEFAFKFSDGKLKAQVFGNGFESKKTRLPLINKADDYALKDFFGEKQVLHLDDRKGQAVLAVITPTIHADGSGSYCEVAQSDTPPEKLGEQFNIPHYFVVYIEFK